MHPATGAGARVLNAIIDKNVVIPAGCEVGVDRESDLAAGYIVTDEGITVLGKAKPMRHDTGPGAGLQPGPHA